MNIQAEIKRQKELIAEHELGNDSYYLSLQYKEDYALLYELEKKFLETKQG